MIVGSKGEKVTELQTYLTDLGYGEALKPEGIDGKFGPHTKNSVMHYQKERMVELLGKGIEEMDGKVGPKTWNSLCIDAGSGSKTLTIPILARISSKTNRC